MFSRVFFKGAFLAACVEAPDPGIDTGGMRDTALPTMTAMCCAFHQGTWVRIAGELIEDNRGEARKFILDAYPNLRNMYDGNDGSTQALYFSILLFRSPTGSYQVLRKPPCCP